MWLVFFIRVWIFFLIHLLNLFFPLLKYYSKALETYFIFLLLFYTQFCVLILFHRVLAAFYRFHLIMYVYTSFYCFEVLQLYLSLHVYAAFYHFCGVISVLRFIVLWCSIYLNMSMLRFTDFVMLCLCYVLPFLWSF